MNSSERIVQGRENDLEQERRRQTIWGGSVGGRQQLAIGMGNLGGWVTSAAMIGAILGGLSGGFCWMARGAARRDVDPESIKKYNEEWEKQRRTSV